MNGGQDDIYNYPKRVWKTLAGLKELLEDDRKLIEKFVEVLKAQNLSLGLVAKYIYHLKASSKILRDQAGTDFNHATAEAMKKLFISLNESNYKPITRTDFVTVFNGLFTNASERPKGSTRNGGKSTSTPRLKTYLHTSSITRQCFHPTSLGKSK